MKLKELEQSYKMIQRIRKINNSNIRYRKSCKNETQKVKGYPNQFY